MESTLREIRVQRHFTDSVSGGISRSFARLAHSAAACAARFAYASFAGLADFLPGILDCGAATHFRGAIASIPRVLRDFSRARRGIGVVLHRRRLLRKI